MLNFVSFESRRFAPPQDEAVSRCLHPEEVRRTVSKGAMQCVVLAVLLGSAVSGGVASAEELFVPGTVLCSNFEQRSRSCRTITTVTALVDGVRHAKSRRMIAMPEENLLLETEGASRVEGLRVCGMGPTAEPRITPSHHSYAEVLLAVYAGRRDKQLARGICHEYRRCGTGWHVYLTFKDGAAPKLVSLTQVFGPDDPNRLGLHLRYREFGIQEPTPSDCAPTG